MIHSLYLLEKSSKHLGVDVHTYEVLLRKILDSTQM